MNRADNLFGGRVDSLEGLAVDTLDPLIVDEPEDPLSEQYLQIGKIAGARGNRR